MPHLLDSKNVYGKTPQSKQHALNEVNLRKNYESLKVSSLK